MCGIAGKFIFGKKELNKNIEIPLIQKTLDKLHHRGPDDKGFYINRNIWLASSRLSIIDLSPAGHQPMQNEDGSISLVFNGEIYNFQDLKQKLVRKYRFFSHTDSEVLLHLYEEYGLDCLKYLRGMFAFAIWDSRKQELFIARDRIGKKPLKYFYNDKFFIFASELKAFIDHPDIPKEIDWEAIDEFLTYQYVPSPKTGFKNIRKLPPAHYMRVKSDGLIEIKRYWDLDFSHKLILSEEEWIERITEKLNESVRLRLKSDVPLGVHLSGGVDSSLITALASEELSVPLNTFSIGFAESDYNELPYAKLVSDRYKTNHHEFKVDHKSLDLLPELVYQFEEPFADPSILPTWLLMQESHKYMTVAMNGDGGDENFAGYRRYYAMKLFNLLKLIPGKKKISSLLSILFQIFKYRDFSSLSKLFILSYYDYKIYYQDLIGFVRPSIKNKLYTKEIVTRITNPRSNIYLQQIFNKVRNIDWLDQVLYVDINSFLPEALLTKADISSMAHSLEVRSPMLDHEFMELLSKMPSNFKLNWFTSKYILKKIAKKYIPEECIRRKKQGFVPPIEHWFRNDKYSFIKSELSDRKFLSYGVFDKTSLNKLIEDHYNYLSNNAYSIWTVLVLKKWFEVWFN